MLFDQDVRYYWCSRFFIRKGGSPARVNVFRCATWRYVFKIKYRMCFVCVIEHRNQILLDGVVGWKKARSG